jgi:transcriptional regulator with XRE-family HTH domain
MGSTPVPRRGNNPGPPWDRQTENPLHRQGASLSIWLGLEVTVERLGALLRSIRTEWGLSLREVKDRTELLAKRWGSPRYASSFSHLAKLELGQHDMRISTLISLSHIYSRRPETLVDACLPPEYHSPVFDPFDGPNSTVLITEGRLYETAERLLPLNGSSADIPDNTALLAGDSSAQRNRYRKAIIGRKDRTLYPMIRPGAIITVDTHQRAIASHKEWTSEFDRPVYLLYTRNGYVCGWCQLDENGTLLNLVSHVMAKLDVLPLVYGRDVEVVGRVVAVSMSLES